MKNVFILAQIEQDANELKAVKQIQVNLIDQL